MAALFLRNVAASVLSPLLRLHPGTLNPRTLSTFLLGPLPKAGFPSTSLLTPSAAVDSRLPGGLRPCLQPAMGFKTKGVIRKRCKDCYLVKRRGRWFIYCKTNPRHKQRQM